MKILISLLISSIVLILAGCAVPMPTNMPDGQGSYTFKLNDNTVATYTGQWVENHPKGQGRATFSYYGSSDSCNGIFGVEPSWNGLPKVDRDIWGKGDVYKNNSLVFSGYFVNNFEHAEACSPSGSGMLIRNGATISGNFRNKMYFIEGPCQLKNISGEQFIGNCTNIPDHKIYVQGLIMMPDVPENIFEMGIGQGIFIDKQGSKYEGYFERGAIMNGIYTVTHLKKPSVLALYNNGELIAENPTPTMMFEYRTQEENRKLAATQVLERKAEANRQAEVSKQQAENDSGFQWGKLAALGLGASIGGIDKLSSDAQTKLVGGMVQDSMSGQQGMSNTNQAAAQLSAPNAGTKSTAESNKALGLSCKGPAKALKPWNDPQVDNYCQMAALDKCLADGGVFDYEVERKTVCNTMKEAVKAMGGNPNACGAPCN